MSSRFYIARTKGYQHKDLHLTSHSVDKALNGSQKRKKRKVLDKSRGLVRITHRVVFEEQRRKWDKVLSKSSNSDHTQAKNTSTKIKNLHLKRSVILQEAGQLDQALSS